MKRNLLSSLIIIALTASVLTGCDNNKDAQETAPSASAQSTDAATQTGKSQGKPTEAAAPEKDAEHVYAEKMSVYVECFNKLQPSINSSLSRYASWLKDFKQGPTGKEGNVYGTYGISKDSLTGCQTDMQRVVALTPALEPIDGIVAPYLASTVPLSNTINEIDEYYTQENYKDDAFAKGKVLHQALLKNIQAYEPVAETWHAAIEEINNKRQLTILKKMEESEGKTFGYYSLAVMISAKQIDRVIGEENFDADAMMQKVSELETLVAQLKESNKESRNAFFVNTASDYALKAKKYIRRVRDKVPYTEFEKGRLNSASGWTIESSYPAALKSYNDLVNGYNRLR